MTCGENLARMLPLHYQRICELTTHPALLDKPSQSRWHDLASLFVFSEVDEGREYWYALATGRGLR